MRPEKLTAILETAADVMWGVGLTLIIAGSVFMHSGENRNKKIEEELSNNPQAARISMEYAYELESNGLLMKNLSYAAFLVGAGLNMYKMERKRASKKDKPENQPESTQSLSQTDSRGRPQDYAL